MKETTKSSTTSMMVGNGNSMDGGFDEQLQSGQHIQIHHHYNIQHHHHHHHYHNQNEVNVGENSLKESLPINATPSNGEEEQKALEKAPPTEALPMNPTLLVNSATEKPYVMIQSAADHQYFLSVVNGKVVTASFDPYDRSQHWYMEDKLPTIIRPFFYLVNKSTGQAIEECNYTVQLITYNPEEIEIQKPLMWTLSFGRDINNTELVVAEDYMRITPFSAFPRNLVKARYSGDPVKIDWYDTNNMLPHMWRVIHYCECVQLP